MKQSRIVAVASGKGGVGKTWLAVTLAHALARTGQRVLLFDGDLGLANVDVQLGLMPMADLGSVLSGRLSLLQAVHHHEGGFDILPGQSGAGHLAALEADALDGVLDALRDAATLYDVVLLDLGAGIDRAVRRMSAFADTLLVVATDEPTSLTDAYAVLKLYAADAAHPDARLVINQAATRAAGQRTFDALSAASRRFLGHAPGLAGIVRRDDHVRDAIRRQSLLLVRHPSTAAAADVEGLASRLFGDQAAQAGFIGRNASVAGRVPIAV